MRIRYGKPIKVKSLVGNQSNLVEKVAGTSGTYHYLGSGGFSNESHWNQNSNVDDFNAPIYNNHTYLLVVYQRVESPYTYSIDHNIVTSPNNDRWMWGKDTGQFFKEDTLTIAYRRYTSDEDATLKNFYIGNVKNKPEKCFMIDLTATFGAGNELTPTEFYNKYNKYFPLIATGEEITIDDKAGQVSLGIRLPSEYQKLDYIEGNGTQYIDSLFNPTNGFKINICFELTDLSSRSTIFGLNGSDKECFFRIDNANIYSFWANTKGSSGYSYANGFEINKKYKVECCFNTQSYLKINNEVLVNLTNSLSFIDHTIPILGEYTVGGILYKAKAKLYSCKIYDLDYNIVRDFIPCYKKSDNVIGLYDLINNQFYTNAGTGTFLKGNNVSNSISCKIAGGNSDIYYNYNQICRNGNFVDSSYWDNDGSTINSVSNNILKFTAYEQWGRIQQYQLHVEQGHKYLVKANIRQQVSGISNSIYIGLRVTANIPLAYSEESKDWQILAGITDPVAETIDNAFLYLGDSRTSGWKEIEVKNIIIIDLTEMYGAGNEPTTVEMFLDKFPNDYYCYYQTPIKLTEKMINYLPLYNWNQLVGIYNVDVSETISGVTFKDNRDGTYTLNGTATADITFFRAVFFQTVTNHKYLFGFKNLTEAVDGLYFVNGNQGIMNTNTMDISTSVNDSNFNIEITVKQGVSFGNIKIIPQIFDLTLMYGSGNEPTTVSSFNMTFPYKYYPFNRGVLLNRYIINSLGIN